MLNGFQVAETQMLAMSDQDQSDCNTDGNFCIPKILSTNYPAISSPSSNIDCLDDLDLEKATDICRDETDCTGFWLYDNGRTCFKSSYNDVAQVNWYCAVKYIGNIGLFHSVLQGQPIIVKTTYSLQEAQESLGVAQKSLGLQQAIIPMTGTTAGDPNSLDQIWSGGSMWWREFDRDCRNVWDSLNCINPMKDLCAAESPPLGKMYACEKKKKTSCSSGYYKNGNTCTGCRSACGAGTRETTACSSSSNRVCTSNSCSCSNGAAATGAACTSNGASICTSCSSGYIKNANNICTAQLSPYYSNGCMTNDQFMIQTAADCTAAGNSNSINGLHFRGREVV